ncbi:unnamed protein product [Phytophthora lilii]|uniref:Unnamed protein product n=1 Tax=Phytophthora lilii TaxID=2077276 RepID=A0A9W6U6T1_9STRA|nr:unnamed protein product [Phytophthora lilii]
MHSSTLCPPNSQQLSEAVIGRVVQGFRRRSSVFNDQRAKHQTSQLVQEGQSVKTRNHTRQPSKRPWDALEDSLESDSGAIRPTKSIKVDERKMIEMIINERKQIRERRRQTKIRYREKKHQEMLNLE